MDERKMLLEKRLNIATALQDEYEVTLQSQGLNDPEILSTYIFIRKPGKEIGYQLKIGLGEKIYVTPEIATFVANNPESIEKYNQLVSWNISCGEIQFDIYDYDKNDIDPEEILGEDFEGTDEEREILEENVVNGLKDRAKNHIAIREFYDTLLIRALSNFGNVAEVPKFKVVRYNASIFKYLRHHSF